MKKGLLLGLAVAGIAAAAAVIYKKSKDNCCCDEYDDDFDQIDGCCCCDDCCDDECDIPADKAEDAGVVVDACACGCEEEELDKMEDVVESNEV